MARFEDNNRCCLCGKPKEEGRKIIVGLHGAVCSDCVSLCNDILLTGGDGSRIIGNRVSDVVGTGVAVATSIQLYQTQRVDVSRNFLLGGGYGVMCESTKSLVYDNHISGGYTLATWQCGGTGNQVVD